MCTLRVKHVYCGTRDAYACGDDARADARLMRARPRRHTRARSETRRAWTRVIDARRREEKNIFLSSRVEVTRARRASRERGRRDGEARDRGRRAFASRAGGDDERIAAGERDVRR